MGVKAGFRYRWDKDQFLTITDVEKDQIWFMWNDGEAGKTNLHYFTSLKLPRIFSFNDYYSQINEI